MYFSLYIFFTFQVWSENHTVCITDMDFFYLVNIWETIISRKLSSIRRHDRARVISLTMMTRKNKDGNLTAVLVFKIQ